LRTVFGEASPAGVGLSAPAGQLALETRGLSKLYGSKRVLHDLSLAVGRGEVFGFLGPNGAGKTTTVKILLGLVRPSGGEALLLGQPSGDPAARRRIGYLPENFRFHDWMTGEGLLDFHGRLAGMSAAERRARIPEVIERVGLAGRGADRIRGYSKGMTQRIGLAQALLNRPELVILDEPTSALDPLGRREVRDLIRELKAEGVTVFLNSHLLSEIEMVCDRVAIVDRGRVVRTGRLGDLADGAVQLKVSVDRVDGPLLSALRRHGTVASVEDGAVLLEVEGLARAADVADAVVRGGRRLFGLTPRQRSLEDVFVELVERGET
jgi:ABC-2 type transport system ATP-binding protein